MLLVVQRQPLSPTALASGTLLRWRLLARGSTLYVFSIICFFFFNLTLFFKFIFGDMGRWGRSCSPWYGVPCLINPDPQSCEGKGGELGSKLLGAQIKVDSAAPLKHPAPMPPTHVTQGMVAAPGKKDCGVSPILRALGSAAGLGSLGCTRHSRTHRLSRVLQCKMDLIL